MNSKLAFPLLCTMNTISSSNDEKNILQFFHPLSVTNENDIIDHEFILKARQLKSSILKNAILIHQILSEIQPFKVTTYEIERSVKTLDRVSTNFEYYSKKVNRISVYMPSNLPLYSFILFGIIPSFMVYEKLIVKPNQLMRDKNIFGRICQALNIETEFQNIEIVYDETQKFTDVYVPNSDIVIFTGYNKNRDKILSLLKPGSLLIYNGSGHNPIVVGKNANIEKAAKDACYARFFNSGQDCAGPDAILVHKDIVDKFMNNYLSEVNMLKVGTYDNENVDVGPIPRKTELQKFLNLLHDTDTNKIIAGGVIDMKQNILYPTVICDKLNDKSNLQEVFGPISFVYTYGQDVDVSLYFNDKNGTYARNKMYVSLYGQNDYVERRNDNTHADATNNVHCNGIGIILYDKSVHDYEEGDKAYGGYSLGASGVYYKINETTFKSKAIPIYVPDIIASHVDGKLFMKTKVTKTADNYKIMNLVEPFKDSAKRSFNDNLVFGFICNFYEDKNNNSVKIFTVFLCLRERNLLQENEFKNQMKKLMSKPDINIVYNINYEITLISKLKSVINDVEINSCEFSYSIAGSKVGVMGDKILLSSLTSTTNRLLKCDKSKKN